MTYGNGLARVCRALSSGKHPTGRPISEMFLDLGAPGRRGYPAGSAGAPARRGTGPCQILAGRRCGCLRRRSSNSAGARLPQPATRQPYRTRVRARTAPSSGLLGVTLPVDCASHARAALILALIPLAPRLGADVPVLASSRLCLAYRMRIRPRSFVGSPAGYPERRCCSPSAALIRPHPGCRTG